VSKIIFDKKKLIADIDFKKENRNY